MLLTIIIFKYCILKDIVYPFCIIIFFFFKNRHV